MFSYDFYYCNKCFVTNFYLQLSNILQKYLFNIHKWFYTVKKEASIDTLDEIISDDVCSNAWIEFFNITYWSNQ